ncbi:MAG: SRPBCC family protein [Chloroflexi bacterium]|nr:SRPBCC family protein [Chloroflexota bacterium]MDA1226756.1 SRPBCC family protein [Chloroflexota bacterium]
MEYKTVDHTLKLAGSPHQVYELLMDSEKHSAFTGGEAKISREVGGNFTIMGGGLGGKNLDLVKDRMIVQSWRAGDWPEGHHSTVTFLLEEEEGETQLSFVQAGVPADKYESINDGWRTYYWVPMSKALEN